jgi:hypothetical protein
MNFCVCRSSFLYRVFCIAVAWVHKKEDRFDEVKG